MARLLRADRKAAVPLSRRIRRFIQVISGYLIFLFQEYERNSVLDFYQHYKYFHFYSVCFGLGWGMALYRPFRPLTVPIVLGIFFTIAFEIVGILSGLPAHTKKCKGAPYDKRDACWGFGFAFFVVFLNLKSYHVYTLSYGCGIIVFALRGAKRKYSSLRKLRERKRAWW